MGDIYIYYLYIYILYIYIRAQSWQLPRQLLRGLHHRFFLCFLRSGNESEIELHAGLGRFLSSLKRGAQREARLRRIQDSAAPLRLRLYVAEEEVLAAGKALRRAMKPAIEEIDRLEAAARAYL